ncbi:hypothetical protein Tco_0506695 [Tanacetum coccineum]
MWEEFTQSIHTFTEDKRNLAKHTLGKKKATLILIPSIRFTKLIIFHLQRLHNFHPRPESPLHLPTEEPALGNLKFIAKGTNGNHKPNNSSMSHSRSTNMMLNQRKVAKHQRHLAGEEVSDPESPAPKPAKPTKQAKPKATKQPTVSKTTTKQPTVSKTTTKQPTVSKTTTKQPTVSKTKAKKPKPAPAKPLRRRGEIRCQKRLGPTLAKRAKSGGDTAKGSRREPNGSTQAQRGITTSPVVFRGNRHWKLQPLPDVPEKWIEKVVIKSKDSIRRPGWTDPGKLDEGQAGPNPDDVAESQPLPTPNDSRRTCQLYRDVVFSPTPNKDFSYGDQFIDDKPSEANNEKTTADTEAESMVSVTIQQDTSVIPPMTSPVIGPSDPIIIKRMGELEELIANLVEENQALEERLDKQGSRINKLETMDLPKMIREQTVELLDSQRLNRKINEINLLTSDMKEILLQRMLEENYDKGHAVHRVAYKALQGSIHRDECEDFDVNKAQEETKKKSKQDSPKTPPGSPPSLPPPPPPPSGASGSSGTTGASDSAQAPPLLPPSSSTHQGGQSTSTAAPSSLKITASVEYSAWTMTDTRIKPSITTILDDLYMDDDITADEQAYSSSEEMEECHKLLTDKVDDAILQYNVSKPLPLGGEPALSISKMKAAFYPDVGLEQLVPDQFWIEEECKYDIIAMYGISHWWFQRHRFYIDKFSSEGDRRAVRTHMRILSVVQIEAFSMYGYNYMKKIIIRHLNHLSPDDKKVLTTAVNLWTRNLVIRQHVEDFQLGIESYQTQLNLTKPRWDATGFEFKHDYTVIDSPKAVTFRDRYGVQMILRFNEIHKFSDGTLQ